MQCVHAALASLVLGLAGCDQGHSESTGAGTGTEASCKSLLQSVKDPPSPSETSPSRTITFIIENKENLEAMNASSAMALWQCIEEGRK